MLDTKVMLREASVEALKKMGDEAIYAAELRATSKVDVISYACTAGAFIKGAEYEQKLLQKIEEVSGARSTSMATAVVEALRFLGVKKIAVAAPYLRTIVEAEEKYLKYHGFDVIHSEALGIVDSLAIAVRPPWENFRFALGVYRKASEAEALFISCGAMRTIEIVEYLEKAIRKPVISSNVCNAWMWLRLSDIIEPIFGYGSLLAGQKVSV